MASRLKDKFNSSRKNLPIWQPPRLNEEYRINQWVLDKDTHAIDAESVQIKLVIRVGSNAVSLRQ